METDTYGPSGINAGSRQAVKRLTVLQGEQGVGFLLLLQRDDDGIQPAFQNFGEAVQGEIDAVVGNAALRIIVSADAFAPVATANQAFTLGRLFALRFLPFDVEQARGKQAHGFGAVFVL